MKSNNLFKTQGNAFRINNQEMTQYPITLIIHDCDYISWTAEGENAFMNQYPYAYLGTSPWLGSITNDMPLPVLHPLNCEIMDLLLGQGEFGVIVYALSDRTLRQSGTKEACEKMRARCNRAKHLLLKITDTDSAEYKDNFAAETDLETVTYNSLDAACELFEELKKEIVRMDRPAYYDKLNREWAEWTNFSITEPLEDSKNRILLVGDSISAGYGNMVQELLPQYHVDRLNTSEGTHHANYYRMLQIALSQYPYEVIHLNNGIHIHGISVEEYTKNLVNIFQWIHLISPGTKIIFATTTSASRKRTISESEVFHSDNFQIGDRAPVLAGQKEESEYRYSPEDSALYIALNKAAVQVCEKCQIPVNDLFTLCVSEDLPKGDYVHFQERGYRRLAEAVAAAVENI